MSLEGGLSNDEVRDVMANNNLHKYYEEGKITLEEYKRLQELFEKVRTQNKNNNDLVIFRDEPKPKSKIVPIIVAAIIIVCIICVINALAHSGRTDSSGGHNDNNNKSGLGGYHYHCGGYPPHLHTNGTCPYKISSSSSSSSSTTSTSSVSYTGATTKTQGDRYDEGYDDGYDDGCNDGYEEGYDDGYDDGHDDGYEEGYEEGKEKGYDEGYEAKAKEANAEREKDFYALLILAGVITLIVLLVKFINRHQKQQ